MGDERMAPSALAPGAGQTIHFNTVFDGGKTPAACGATGPVCPAASEWRYVTCIKCLEHSPPAILALALGYAERRRLQPTGPIINVEESPDDAATPPREETPR